MIASIRDLDRRLQPYLGPLTLVGLVAVGCYNRWLWQRDRALLDTNAQPDQIRPLDEWPRKPLVSVLVAAWNESHHIDTHILSFLGLSYPEIELILCAGGSDDTLIRARNYAGTKVTVLEQQPGEGKQRALARCLDHASGEIIYLTDADCVFDNEALVRILSPLALDGEHVTTGTSRPLDNQLDKLLPFHLWSADVASSARWGPYVEGLLGRNTVVTHHAISAIGGLDFVALTGTDYQLARRLLRSGFMIHYVGASVVPSEYPQTIATYRQKQSRWLRNLLIHGRHYGAEHDVRLTQRTIATGLVMTFLPLLALPFGLGVLASWALLVAHASASKVRYAYFTAATTGRSLPRRYLLSVVPLTLVDFAVWAFPVIDLFNPRRRERW
jgi:cellulose synthase/poly-beta-1,6-N-acetylglucosamine synthase-like glycosyltransferase